MSDAKAQALVIVNLNLYYGSDPKPWNPTLGPCDDILLCSSWPREQVGIRRIFYFMLIKIIFNFKEPIKTQSSMQHFLWLAFPSSELIDQLFIWLIM